MPFLMTCGELGAILGCVPVSLYCIAYLCESHSATASRCTLSKSVQSSGLRIIKPQYRDDREQNRHHATTSSLSDGCPDNRPSIIWHRSGASPQSPSAVRIMPQNECDLASRVAATPQQCGGTERVAALQPYQIPRCTMSRNPDSSLQLLELPVRLRGCRTRYENAMEHSSHRITNLMR
ncbi:hypothetical protein K491DRAFT_99006 [Lophiostoma macrostomum CBS 122681]|uniref:Uncharacterized protein n=1 Tax=Lophiostoma macrostomum CBS 122681 TaxID=1314788 RepID=A0A6A6SUG1_9PLEO|nr:hypothetical protein K491DRAFT_99006 [Lophiostoma macrostomum CBS 122681]